MEKAKLAKVLKTHNKVMGMSTLELLGTYYLDKRLKRVHMDFLLGLRQLFLNTADTIVLSEEMLARGFNTSESQIQRWKKVLSKWGYLHWKRSTSSHVRYFLGLPAVETPKMGVRVNSYSTLSIHSEDLTHPSDLRSEVFVDLFVNIREFCSSLDYRRNKDERSESIPIAESVNKLTPTEKAEAAISHWNSKGGLTSHTRKKTKVYRTAMRVLVSIFEAEKYSYEEVTDAIDNFNTMALNRHKYTIAIFDMTLPDFLDPGSYSFRFSKRYHGACLEKCLRKYAPLEKYYRNPDKTNLGDDPNPELTALFLKALKRVNPYLKYWVTGLHKNQQQALIEVVTRLKRLASEQPSNNNGSSLGVNFQIASEHLIKAADEFFVTWRGVEDRGVTPNMLKNEQFWKEEFPRWERENHITNGIRFSKKFMKSIG